MAIEQPDYTVIDQLGDDVEIRQYDPYIVAETLVANNYSFEAAGNEAFRRLAGYIFGNNRRGDEIAMTAPVNQMGNEAGWRISFMMPAGFTLKTLPQPVDRRVKLRQLPGRLMAALRYSGGWGESKYRRKESRLLAAVAEAGAEISGAPEFARYNAPFIPPFLRRNEILVPLATMPMGEIGVRAAAAL